MAVQIDYTAKDYDGFVKFLKDAIPEHLPEWQSRSPSDPGIVFIEMFSYIGDILSFYGDRIANEAFLSTATLRRSVLDIARLLDYQPAGFASSQAYVDFNFEAGNGVVLVPKGTRVGTDSVVATLNGETQIIFTVDADTTVDTDSVTTQSILCTEGRYVYNEFVGASDGSPLQQVPLLNKQADTLSLEVFVDEGSGLLAWEVYDRLIDAAYLETALSFERTEDDTIYLNFGDDSNGKVPAQGATLYATYRVTEGAAGNVALASLTELVDTVEFVTTVTNPAAAFGGSDPETNTEIKRNAPRSIYAINRAVTLKDYESLAYRSGLVGKAKATASVYTNVLVYLASKGSTAAALNAATKTFVQDDLLERSLVGVSVTVMDPTFVPIDVTLAVSGDPTILSTQTEGDVITAVADLLAYEEREFGETLRIADLYRAIADVPAVINFTVTVYDRDAGVTAGDIVLADEEIAIIGTLDITVTGGI